MLSSLTYQKTIKAVLTAGVLSQSVLTGQPREQDGRLAGPPPDSAYSDSAVVELSPKRVRENKFRLDDSPVRAHIIERREIERTPANNLIDLLDGQPGLRKKIDCSACNTAQIRLLGLNAAYTQFLLDGLPSYSGLGLVYGIEQIPLVNIRRVEVVKGAGNVKHGNNAIAGVVNIVTENPGPNPILYCNLRYGHHNEQDYEGFYSGIIGKLGTQFAFSKSLSPALNMDNDIVEDVAEFDRSYYSGRLSFSTTPRFSWFYSFSSASEDRFGGTEASSREWIGRFQMDSTFTNDWGDEVHQPLIYQEYVRTKRVSYETGTRILLGRKIMNEMRLTMLEHYQDSYYGYLGIEAKQRIYHGENDLTWFADRHEVLCGMAWHYDDFRDNRSIGTHKYNVPAVYAQDTYSPTSVWQLLGGMRFDYHNVHGPVLSPRIGLRYTGLKHFIFRFNGGSGFRTFNLFSENHMATTSDVYQLVPNSHLKAEKSWTGMLSADYAAVLPFAGDGDALNLGLSLYHTQIRDYIQPYYLQTYSDYGRPYTDDGRQKVVYENLPGRTVAQGLEITGRIALPRGIALDGGLNILDNYNSRKDKYGRIYYTPDYTAMASISWEHARWGVRAALDGNTVGPQLLREVRFGEDILIKPERESRPYYLINASAEKSIGVLNIVLGVRNLTDFYQARVEPVLYHRGWYVATTSVWAPMKGRTFYGGIRIRTGKVFNAKSMTFKK